MVKCNITERGPLRGCSIEKGVKMVWKIDQLIKVAGKIGRNTFRDVFPDLTNG